MPPSEPSKFARAPSPDEVDLIDVMNDLQNKLVASGHSLDISLPQIVVIGCQSAGKSSVLESFVGKRFMFVEFHHAYDDTFQSSSSPATVIAAGPGELWENGITYNRLNNVSNSSTKSRKCLEKNHKTSGSLERNRTSKSNTATNKSHFKTSYQNKYDEEERDLMKKEKLYIAALNSGRPDGYPKILKLPNVGYLPTIFEKMPYPVTAEVLRSLAKEESADVSKTADVPKQETVHSQLDTKKDEKRLGRMLTAENVVVEEHVPTQLTTNKVGEKTTRIQKANKAQKEPISMQLSDNTAKKETVCLQLAEDAGGEEATPQIPKQKKKFRKLRKFFGRFSCIHKVKD